MNDVRYGKFCPEYVTNLVRQIEPPGLENGKKVLLIYLLGELGPTDTNSIGVLIKNVDFEAEKQDPKTRIRRWGQYPAQEALIKVDKAAVKPILNDLPSETKELRRQLLCSVLVTVEGHGKDGYNDERGKPIVREYLLEKFEKESDRAKRANIWACLENLKSLDLHN